MKEATATATGTPVLYGIHGRLEIRVSGKTLGTLVVDEEHLELTREAGPADATAHFATAADAGRFLRGQVNPVVAALRRRVMLEGDRTFAAHVNLGLRAGTPIGGIAVDRLVGAAASPSTEREK